jgi:hypothetical protein
MAARTFAVSFETPRKSAAPQDDGSGNAAVESISLPTGAADPYSTNLTVSATLAREVR